MLTCAFELRSLLILIRCWPRHQKGKRTGRGRYLWPWKTRINISTSNSIFNFLSIPSSWTLSTHKQVLAVDYRLFKKIECTVKTPQPVKNRKSDYEEF